MAVPTTTKPFLDSGDRLSRAEFHRRYLERPDIRRAELIDGVVYVASPTRFAFHDKQAAASTVSYERYKKAVYRRNGVREYVVWRVLEGAIDWFRLQDGEYVLVEPDPDGVIESAHFPGLRLDVPAMLAGDKTRVLAALSRSS